MNLNVVTVTATATLLACAALASAQQGTATADAAKAKEAARMAEAAKYTVTITSSKDASAQQALLYVPPEAAPDQKGRAAPLLVALHTWSADYTQCVEYLLQVRQRGWALVAPNFRGPNQRPDACVSSLAIQDVLDAVEHAGKHARVDESRIYLMGYSGGGHMALMMAAAAPRTWAGASAGVPITDLAAWHAENVAAVLFRRVAGPVRVTIFEGGHGCEIPASLHWLSRQRRGAPPAHQPEPETPGQPKPRQKK